MAVLKGRAAPAGVAAAAPAVAAVPDAPAATEQGADESAKPDAAKPKAKPEKPAPAAAAPANSREATIAKFAKAMNNDAEKDGVAVDAPPAERRGKPGPKPGAKREPKPEAALEQETPAPTKKPQPAAQAQPTPEPELDDAEPDEAQVDDDDDAGTPEPRATHQLKAKARLRHGDVDKALRIAFGDMKPEEFEGVREQLAKKLGVGSKQWADLRRYASEREGKAKQLEAKAIEVSQRARSEFAGMFEAREAYKAKDYPRAFELAFPGEDINSFQRKAIHQHLSKDPEKARLQQQIDELRGELVKVKQPAQSQEQGSPEQTQAAALQREGDRTHAALTQQTDDPELAHFARKASFIRRVVELRGEHYDPHTKTTIPLRVAADMARDEKKRELESWRYDQDTGESALNSELPGQAGNEPVRTSPRARSPIPSQAAQAGGSTRSMSREERIKAFAARM